MQVIFGEMVLCVFIHTHTHIHNMSNSRMQCLTLSMIRTTKLCTNTDRKRSYKRCMKYSTNGQQWEMIISEDVVM